MNEQDPNMSQSEAPNKEARATDVTTNTSQVENSTDCSTTQSLSHTGAKIVSFRSLCRCGDEVWIENDGTIYRLRRTKLGKLILTK